MLLRDVRTVVPSVRQRRHLRGLETTMTGRYVGRMPVTANQVAAAIREHLPQAQGATLERLLYYVQGHHLALFGRPAFVEEIVAGLRGPEVKSFRDDRLEHVRGGLDQPLLNVVLLTVTRYGGLTSGDLDRLTMAETPWRTTGRFESISQDLLVAFFGHDGRFDTIDDDPEGDDLEHQRRIGQEVERIRAEGPGEPDDFDDLLSEVIGRAH